MQAFLSQPDMTLGFDQLQPYPHTLKERAAGEANGCAFAGRRRWWYRSYTSTLTSLNPAPQGCAQRAAGGAVGWACSGRRCWWFTSYPSLLKYPRTCTPGLRAEGGWWGGRLGLCWVTPLVALGARRQLCAADLFELPAELQPGACAAVLWREWSQAC